jgi:transitional endoplasmic reticulum ATPase
MHTLHDRKIPIPSLYVKSAPNTYSIRSVFTFARQMAPCMLILEDIDTIVTKSTRSYFFNEVDGLENSRSNASVLLKSLADPYFQTMVYSW